MIVFERNSKINFVDSNNVFLGYDNEQSCCEYFGWFIDNYKHPKVPENFTEFQPTNLDGWDFDPDFYEGSEENQYDVEGMAVFRLVHRVEGQKFLHLFNHHNGYYGHGFTFKIIDGRVIQEGGL